MSQFGSGGCFMLIFQGPMQLGAFVVLAIVNRSLRDRLLRECYSII